MATTINSNLNDDIIAKDGLEAFVDALAPLAMFSTDYSKEAKAAGAAIQVPLIGGITASTTENDYETETGSMSAVTVTLNGYAKATVGLSDRQFAECSSASLKKFARQLGASVAGKVIEGIFSKITKTNFPTNITPVAGQSMQKLLLQAREAFGTAKVPLGDRAYFPTASAFMALAEDPTVQVASALAYGGTEFVRDGVIPRLLGFNIFESTVMPTSSAAPNGFVIHPSALAVAMRPVIPSDQKGVLEHRTVNDPQTGMTLSYRRHYSAATGKHFLTFEVYYGSAVGINTAAILMPSIPAEASA